MVDIPLLTPVVLQKVVEEFVTPQSLPMLAAIPRTPYPFPTAQWDIVRGSRAVARPNVPNSEAHIVPRLGRGTGSAAFAYFREKKVFEPTTLYWIRQAGSLTGLERAEAAILREMNDLNGRLDRAVELYIWQALTGRILDTRLADIPVDVDFQFDATHKPAFVAASWAAATPAQIVANIKSWKMLIKRDAQVEATDAWTSEKVLSYIYDAFATTGASNFPGAALLSDRMKDAYYATGELPGFMGLNWHVNANVYDPTDSGYGPNPTAPADDTLYVPDNALMIGNFTENRPIELYEGPTADLDKAQGGTGKFAKSWTEEDPSAEQILLEWHCLPIITRPDQFVYVADVTDTTP